MKKILSVLLSAVIMLFSVSACFGGVASGLEDKAYKKKTAEIKEFSNKLNALIDAHDNSSEPFSAIASIEAEEEEVSKDELFETARLIVYTDGDIDECGASEHLSGLDDMHILQYETKEQAIKAYEFYCSSKDIDSVEPDVIVTLDSEDNVVLTENSSAKSVTPYSDYDDFKESSVFINHSWGYDYIQTSAAFQYILQQKSIKDLPEIVVGIIDGGVREYNEEFNQRLLKSVSFTGGIEPSGYHGTAVAIVIYENTLPNVKFISYKVFKDGKSTLSLTQLGEKQAALDGVDIINCSYGAPAELDTPVKLDSVEERINNDKPLQIASAGNHGSTTPQQPACLQDFISVANLDITEDRASSSGFGKNRVDVAAPGAGTVIDWDKYHLEFSGTSCAAPFVVSVCAMLMSQYPSLLNTDITQILFDSCNSDLGVLVKFGIVNMFKAVTYFDGSAQSPEMPQFSLESMPSQNKFYNAVQYLELSCTDENAEIYYTLDHTIPNKINGTLYTEPIELSSTTLVWAAAYYGNELHSEIAKRTFYIRLPQDDIPNENGWLIRDNGMIWGYIGADMDLVVPETVLGIPVIGIETKAFSENSYITSIVMPECVEIIEERAFYHCSALESVVAPGVKDVESSAFRFCSRLNFVSMPSLETIKTLAFSSTGSLEGFPFENLTKIPRSAFSNSDVVRVNLENAVFIDSRAFYSCRQLIEANLPKIDAESIGIGIFEDCLMLEKITINPSCDILAERMFSNSGLTAVDFLSDIAYTDEEALAYCKNLTYVSMPALKASGIGLFKEDEVLEKIIAPNLQLIDDETFYNCSSLTTLQLSEDVVCLEGNVFNGCTSLKYLMLYGDFWLRNSTFANCLLERLEMNRVKSLASLPDTQNCIIAMPSTFTECTENTVGRNYKVYGTKGTYAEQWANENGHEFIEISQETALFQDVPMEYIGEEPLTVDVIGFNRTYQWYSNTVADNTSGTPIEGATDKEFNPADYPASPYYYCVVTSTDIGYDPVEIRTGVTANKATSADYTQLYEAIGKIPDDLSIYTDESVSALQEVLDSIDYNLNITEQEKVNAYAEAIEIAIKALQYKSADYTKVYEAIEQIPEDLSIYTDESVAALQEVLDSVNYDLNITEQEKIDAYAKAITDALNGLELKPEKTYILLGDINNDGKITVLDAKLLLRALANSISLDETQLFAADVNQDGKISVVDAKWILQIVSNMREPVFIEVIK